MTPLSWSTVHASYDPELSGVPGSNVLLSDTTFFLGGANTTCLYYNSWSQLRGCGRVHHQLTEEDEGTEVEQYEIDSHEVLTHGPALLLVLPHSLAMNITAAGDKWLCML